MPTCPRALPCAPRTRRRAVAALAIVATLASAAAVAPAAAATTDVDITWTTADGSRQLTASRAGLTAVTDARADVSIAVNPAASRQRFTGFGGSLDSSSVANIVGMPFWDRYAVMNLMFNADGNRYDLMRLSFGCSDFCATPKDTYYTYHDEPGHCGPGGMPHFSIRKDVETGIVSVAQQAKQINPDVRFFASVWSPPAWMKTNGALSGGGHVKRECYDALATYYRLAIEAYAAHGIPIDAVTAQNEPTVVMPYPTTEWTWWEQRDFVKVLGAELRDHGLGDVKIWIQDDNLLRTQEFAGQILADPEAAQFVDGVGYHDYEGDPGYTGDLGQVADILARHPDVTQHITERSYYGVDGAARLADAFRNGISSYSYWLTLLDTAGQPNAGPLDGAKYPQQFGVEHGNLANWWVNPDYYFYGQWSRYVDRGAHLVDSSPHANRVYNAAFRNPDGEVVVVAVNTADQTRSVRIVSPGGQVTETLPARSVATFRWHDPAPAAYATTGWRAYPSVSHPGQPGPAAFDHRLDTRWSTGQAQQRGQEFILDMGRVQPVRHISLFNVPVDDPAGQFDHPRWYEVRTSRDGRMWSSPLAWGPGTPDLTVVRLDQAREARWVRITQTGTAENWWSISEVVVSGG